MKLLVLGATGGIGMEIVRQAINGGHAVTALVRNPAPLKVFREVTIRQGNPLTTVELERAIAGHDAVLSGFGPRPAVASAEANLLREFASALTRAMTTTGVKRVVVVSVAFLFKDSILPPAYIVGRLLFPRTVADARAMECVFADSGLDWTIVRPPRLTDKPRTGKYRIREGHLPGLGFTISRADVADFVLGALENRNTVHKVFGVSN